MFRLLIICLRPGHTKDDNYKDNDKYRVLEIVLSFKAESIPQL